MSNDFELDVAGWVMGWTVAQLIGRGTSAEASIQRGAIEVHCVALESPMHNVIPFQARTAPQAPPIASIDGTSLQWISLAELREKLWRWDSIKQDSPDAVRQVVRFAAENLIMDCNNDADARKLGWVSVAAMRERGQDMLKILEEHAAQKGLQV